MSSEVHHIVAGVCESKSFGKDIKNLHLGVYPPNGRVRVATPLRVNDDAVRLAVIADWRGETPAGAVRNPTAPV